MAPAEGADAPSSASASGRQPSSRRQLWAAVLCFGSRRGKAPAAGTPWWRAWRRKRTVAPVDGLLVAWPPADREMGHGEEAAKLSLLRSCCFLPPACVPGRKHDIRGSRRGSNTHQKRRQQEQQPRPQNGKNPPSEAASARQFQATARRAEQARVAPTAAHGVAETREPTRHTTPRGENTGRNESPAARSSTKAACHGTRERGPVVGLSVVVAAVSMAGLLGGRLWAVVCVCAWFLALSRLKRKAAPPPADGTRSSGEGADVNSADYKKFVVLSGAARARSQAAPVNY